VWAFWNFLENFFIWGHFGAGKEDIMRLSDMPIGSKSIIIGFNKDASLKYLSRLLSMGVTRGEEVEIIRKSPIGDSVVIKLRGYELVLRYNEIDILLLQ